MSLNTLLVARATLAGLAVFAVYYPYKLFSSFAPFAFSGPGSWQSHWLIDDTVLVPLWARMVQFGLWMPTVLATQAMIFLSLYLVWLIQKDIVFERKTVKTLKWVGLSAAAAGVFAIVAIALDGWWFTAWNIEKPRLPIKLHLESGEMGVMLCGLGLFLLAHVVEIAAFKKRENEEIV